MLRAMSMYNVTRAMVEKILSNAQQMKWTYMGLGLIKLYLNNNVRLHVWDIRKAVDGVTMMHDHPWDFTSTVIAGCVRQIRYREYTGHDGAKYIPFIKGRVECGVGLCPNTAVREVRLIGGEPEIYQHGDSYHQFAHEIHYTQPDIGTVTVVEAAFNPGSDKTASVYWQKDTEFVSAGRTRQATPDEVEHFTRTALTRHFGFEVQPSKLRL